MNKKLGIYLFTNDLRIYDNLSLIECIKSVDFIISIVIYDPPKCKNAEYFYNEAIEYLDTIYRGFKLVLYFLPKNKSDVLQKIYNIYKERYSIKFFISRYYTREYTRFVKQLSSITEVIETDNTLIPIVSDEKVYVKFTPFYNSVKDLDIPKPYSIRNFSKFISFKDPLVQQIPELPKSKNLPFYPMDIYNLLRQLPREVSYLSSFINLGLVSTRALWHKFPTEDFRRKLIWGVFYYRIFYYNDLNFEQLKDLSFKFKWKKDPKYSNKIIKEFEKCKTEYDEINEIMKKLITTGFINNRERLIISMCLIKTYKVHWTYGEKLFEKYLIDYEPIINNLNWQWSWGVFDYYDRGFSLDNQLKKLKKIEKSLE